MQYVFVSLQLNSRAECFPEARIAQILIPDVCEAMSQQKKAAEKEAAEKEAAEKEAAEKEAAEKEAAEKEEAEKKANEGDPMAEESLKRLKLSE
ncbi:hypothetical protein HO133_006533 [Letharia lupina]|uniref:Uncharacterized protein n=1 Tax=Letharia lupina TaxID=560253 RepID=A0A8H6C6V8_9LECA|nr:uncharacterized protein HO133_006533 [Letharia lupina]KAF6217706.1 hypothetical protein HO133_006533 [Letharia lupina]